MNKETVYLFDITNEFISDLVAAISRRDPRITNVEINSINTPAIGVVGVEFLIKFRLTDLPLGPRYRRWRYEMSAVEWNRYYPSLTDIVNRVISKFFLVNPPFKVESNAPVTIEMPDGFVPTFVRANGKTKALKEMEKKHMKELEIKDVIFNNPATIVFWSDGTKTVVKAQWKDKFDPEKGLAMAISKKVFGNKYSYYDIFQKHIGRYEKKARKK